MTKTIENNVRDWVNNYIGPNFVFRDHQLDVIVSVIENVVSDVKPTHIIEAPTGSGKSLILIISAGVLNEYYDKKSYILCSDLFLWKQYDDFIKAHPKIKDKFGSLKGQTGNYICDKNKEDIRNAACRIAKIPWSNLFSKTEAIKHNFPCAIDCPYVKARKKAQESKVTMMTYQLYLYMFNVVGPMMKNPPFTRRDVIFCDECHNIPSVMSSQYSPSIYPELVDKLVDIYRYNKQLFTGLFSNLNEIKPLGERWDNERDLEREFNDIYNRMLQPMSNIDAYNICIDYVDKFISEFSPTVGVMEDNLAILQKQGQTPSHEVANIYKSASWFRNYCCLCNDFKTAIMDCGAQYVIKTVTEKLHIENSNPTVSFKCAKEDYMCYRYLLMTSNHHVLTSATIGMKSSYCDNIGMKYMDDPEPLVKKIPSTFDFSKSPIIVYPKYWMSYRDKNVTFPKLKEMTYEIIKKFKGFRGIIQTGSYENAMSLYKSAPIAIKNRLLLYNNSSEKTVTIDFHKMMPDTVLIGPTLNEGIDLPDDMCRFIVILKVPYPSLVDELVKAKMQLFPNWYNSETSNHIIQGIGRGNRHKDDWCVTYILDGCFTTLYANTREQFSPELQNRIKYIK